MLLIQTRLIHIESQPKKVVHVVVEVVVILAVVFVAVHVVVGLVIIVVGHRNI